MDVIKRWFGGQKRPEAETSPPSVSPASVAPASVSPHSVPPHSVSPHSVAPPPDSRAFQIDNALATTRRELVRVVTRDTLRASGIPDPWLEWLVLLELGRGGQAFVHLRLVVKHWDLRLLQYAVAFQNRLLEAAVAIDPQAREWLASITWQYQANGSCPYPDLPDPASWRAGVPAEALAAPAAAAAAPAAAPDDGAVDLLLDIDSTDEVSEDLQRLFAIRDANLPGGTAR